MARLVSQAKKGYYKTPPHLIPAMAKYLRVLDDVENVKVLDPCAGEGEALALLGDALGLERHQLYANEVDEARFQACTTLGVNAACGDAIDEMRTTWGAYGLLYLNPPYDDEGNGDGRTEAKFLWASSKHLCQNGTLIFVVPKFVLAKPEVAKILPIAFKDIAVFKFPEEDYQAFGQVVLIGRKMRGESRMFVDQYNAALASMGTLGNDGPTFIVPGTGPRQPYFYSQNLTEEQITKLANAGMAESFLEGGLTVDVETKVKTLMPLRSGHQALMLASGMMDGAYKDPSSGNVWVISGKTEMVSKRTEEAGENGAMIEKIRHTPMPLVKVLDLTESQATAEIILYDLK